MVEKQEDRFDLRSLFIKNNYLKVFIWRNFLSWFFEVDLIIFPTIYYGPKLDKKWASKLALEDLPKEPCGQKNPNRKFGKKERRQNVIFKPPGLLVRQRLILIVLKLYKYDLLSHKLEIFWEETQRSIIILLLHSFYFFLVLCVYYLCLC